MIGNTLTLGEHLTLPVEERVVRLVAKMTRIVPERLAPTARLFHDLGISGDDADQLILAFIVEFAVDFSGFRFADYFSDEAASSAIYRVMLWKRGRKAKSPLTVGDLIEIAKARSFEAALRT